MQVSPDKPQAHKRKAKGPIQSIELTKNLSWLAGIFFLGSGILNF